MDTGWYIWCRWHFSTFLKVTGWVYMHYQCNSHINHSQTALLFVLTYLVWCLTDYVFHWEALSWYWNDFWMTQSLKNWHYNWLFFFVPLGCPARRSGLPHLPEPLELTQRLIEGRQKRPIIVLFPSLPQTLSAGLWAFLPGGETQMSPLPVTLH